MSNFLMTLITHQGILLKPAAASVSSEIIIMIEISM